MAKALFQLSIIIVLLWAAWFGLSHVNFVERFHLYDISTKTEKKVGDAIIATIERTEKMVDGDSTAAIMLKVQRKLVWGNRIIPYDTKLHIVKSKEINAFALPGNHIIVYTGLIEHCDSVEELCGVIGHEMAHIQLRHVMKRLASELGITVLASVTTGNSAVINSIVKTLSSTAFERSQESDADAAAVQYLIHSHIEPHAFAGFMRKIAAEHDQPDIMEWISTHPNSAARADVIMQLIGNTKQTYEPVLDKGEWQYLKAAASAK